MDVFLLPLFIAAYLAAVGVLGKLIVAVSPPWLARILSARIG